MIKLTPEDINDGYEHGMLVRGDCLDVLYQLPANTIDLIYTDPPFASQKQWESEWKELTDDKINGFNDLWEYGIEGYILYMIPRLRACYRVLKPSGSMYLHCDHHASHYLKIEMDKIFGEKDTTEKDNQKGRKINIQKGGKCFNTQITWRRTGSKGNAKTFANNSDYILFYSKNRSHPKFEFDIQYDKYSESTLKMFKYNDNDGRGFYKSTDVSAPGGDGYRYDLGYDEKQPSGGYRWIKETMLRKISENKVVIEAGKVPRQKRYLNEGKGAPFDNIWTDIENVKSPDYPTQKPIELMERILESSSIPSKIVLDPFCGSGPFIKAGLDSGRRVIGIDISLEAITKTKNRLLAPAIKVHGVEDEDIEQFINDNNLNSNQEKEYQDLMNMMKDPVSKKFEIRICTMWGGKPNYYKVRDGGLDGHKYRDGKKIGLQVKKTEVNGVNYRQFKNDLREQGCASGTMISDSFNAGAEKNRVNDACNPDTSHYIHINFITIKQLIKNAMFNNIKEILSPTPELSKYMSIKQDNFF